MVNMKSFWKNKKVLVTGYEGFLGSNLTKRLISEGAEVTGLDIITGREETILDSEDITKVKIENGDVDDYDTVSRLIEENSIEVIFHLAAEAIVGRSLNDPVRTFRSTP